MDWATVDVHSSKNLANLPICRNFNHGIDVTE